MAIGRITGPMLFSNLERQGVDLAIEGNLIYADVTNLRVGVNTSTPEYDLDVFGNARLSSLVVYNNTITSDTGKIDLGTIANVVIHGGANEYVITTDGNGNLTFMDLADLADFGNLYSSIEGANAAIVTANSEMKMYVDTLNSEMAANVAGANSAIITANSEMKMYVDTLNSEMAGNILGANIAWEANASTQQSLIDGLQGNLSAANIAWMANAASQQSTIDSLVSNAASQQTTIDTLVSEAYSNANAASYFTTYSGNISAGNITVTTQAEITKTITTDGIFWANGDNYASSVTGTYSNSNVASYLTTYTGDISANSINTDYINGNLHATGNLYVSGPILRVPTDTTTYADTPAGAIRFNNGSSVFEYFDGSNWVSLNNTVSDQQLVGDNTTQIFTLTHSAVESSILVSINGVLQNPATAYSVSGNQITFVQAPLDTDYIDVRFMASAVTPNLLQYTGNINLSGNLIPGANVTYSLGDATHWWKDIYVGSNTIYLGGVPISVSNGTLLVNGELVTGSYSNVNVAAYLAGNITVGNITSGKWSSTAVEIAHGGTGATSAVQALTNLLPAGGNAGEVLTTNGPGSFYWSTPTGGSGSNQGTRIATTRNIVVATAGQTLFEDIGTYVPGEGQLRVYINGVRQFDTEYTETSETSFTLDDPANEGEVVLVEIDGYESYVQYANLTAYTPSGSLTDTNVQSAIDSLQSIVTTSNSSMKSYVDAQITSHTGTNITQVGTITSGTWTGSTLAINYGGTGATSAGQALTNLLPTGTTAGYVLTTNGPGSFYWAAAGGGSTNQGTKIDTTRTTYTATAGQTLFTGTGTYTPGAGQLRIYQNGVRQFPSEYTETSSTSFTLGTGATVGDVILAEVDAYVSYTVFANAVVYNPTGDIPVTSNTAQLAIDSLESRKAALSGATFTGDVTITGNLSVANLTSQTTQILSVTDPLVYLNASAPQTYNYEIGTYSHFGNMSLSYPTANYYQHTGLVRDHSDGTWKLFSNVAEPAGGVVSFTNAIYDAAKVGALTVANTTTSTSTSTGALVVSGGAGIAGNVYATTFYGAGTGLTGTATGLSVGSAGTATSATTANVATYGTTQSSGTNNTTLATTAFVSSAMSALLPTGVITMWSGASTSIPSGWYLCNGLNGTPDLRDRFVIGAGSTYAVGASGGATTVTLSSSNLPSHTHTFSGSGSGTSDSALSTHSHTFSGTSGTQSANHTHTATVTDPGHQHYDGPDAQSGGGTTTGGGFASITQAGAGSSIHTSTSTTGISVSLGIQSANHTHDYSGTTSSQNLSHTHITSVSISGTSGATGSGTSFGILPPYYALCFIMKA